MFEDGEGTLWVGTFGGGLDRFDREKGTFTHFAHSDSDSTSISDNSVLSMCEDKKGNFWIGTAGGLNLMDRQSGRFWHVRERDGLPSDLVIGILEDREGDLWMSTAKGICRFTPSSKTFHVYDESDGLQGREFNQGAFTKDVRTGEMYFGGPNGLNVFDPANVKNNPYVPPLVFSSFTRYNTDDAAGKPILEKGISAKSHVVISYKDNVSTFEFAALSFYNAQKNRYAYRLEGYADNWIQLGTDRRATFTNLDGGEYVLHIRGSNNDGVWNDNGASLRLTVTPPWWKTTWAYGSYIILAFGFLYSARRVEINRREQKTRIRESELRAKAVEAEKKVLQIENDRQTKELEDARNLQLSMLPREVPKVPGYEIAVFMKTATEVGGDYYDFTVTPEGMLNVAFGDATGHGMQAGTIVTLMKGLFISDAAKFDIQNFFNHCSRAIKEIKLGRLYMALTLARFHGKSVSLSSAGMPPAYLHRRDDGAIEEILLKAVPLGSMKNFPYGLYETQLEDGDTLLLLTDGLPEQKNTSEEMFDYARVIDRFKDVASSSPGEIIQHLVKDAEAWMDGATQDDDITLMVVRKIAVD
jgi:serine phosphatase RsbU (regulator of sigma subunit)